MEDCDQLFTIFMGVSCLLMRPKKGEFLARGRFAGTGDVDFDASASISILPSSRDGRVSSQGYDFVASNTQWTYEE